MKIVLPNQLIRIAGDGYADFKATLQESTVIRRFDAIPVESLDLASHLALRDPPAAGSIQIQGTQLVVDGVRSDQVRLLLDLSGVKHTGQYVLHPRPETPSSVTVVDWTPKDLTVEVVSSGK